MQPFGVWHDSGFEFYQNARPGVASMPTEWHLANQLAHPPVALRRFDDGADSEFPFPRKY
jgi:hypothetical protein